MSKKLILAASALSLLIAAAASAQSLQSLKAKASERPPREEASIPFADNGGIDDWYADGRDGLYVKGRGRDNWYYARFMGPCSGLPFAHTIGFKSEPTGSFDRFSAVIVDGERCPLTSLVESPPPPKREKRS